MAPRIVPFQAKHVAALVLHPGAPVPPIPADMADAFARGGPALSAIDEFGNVIAAGGLLPRSDAAALAWHLIGYRACLHMVTLHRAARELLESRSFPRVELHMDIGYSPNAFRWAGMLGFAPETPQPMRHFLGRDRDAFMFSKITT